MLRTTVRADETTDIDAAVSNLRAQCERAGIAPHMIGLLSRQVQDILTPLVHRGRQLAGQGSQISVTRELTGDGYAVQLVFGAGKGKSFLQKILDAVRGR